MRSRSVRRSQGFTLVEIVAVIGVIAILAAVMVPTIVKHLEDSKTVRAQKDAEMIATSVTDFYKDTGRWPTRNTKGEYEVELLQNANGTAPTLGTKVTGWGKLNVTDSYDNQLVDNKPGGKNKNKYDVTGENRWNGPYAIKMKTDPWGRQYWCNVASLHPTVMAAGNAPVWIISAGPDGVLDTDTDDTDVQGDDVGFLIKR
ncbi:MAG: type II secretion system protein GspG [Candidatus Eisenbacteria bacterium]|nr:type II secretion system protein GspG [Candidatus Eisenbacteria bacterium]